MSKYLVAVSGGVDSVVLLDMLARAKTGELIVAHFDHGIRPESADDALFVRLLAKKYRLPFVTRREELGLAASEEVARIRRYAFLRSEAKRHDAAIITAHHADDIVETVAINSIRGTGWRGLAVLNSGDIARPLLQFTKDEIKQYALDNRLEWVEDGTNGSQKYLRNRVRRRLAKLSSDKKDLIRTMRQNQISLAKAIDKEVELLLKNQTGEYSRYFFTLIDDASACELLRRVIANHAHSNLPRPQIARALIAIKTARPSSLCDVGGGVKILFTGRTFIVETP